MAMAVIGTAKPARDSGEIEFEVGSLRIRRRFLVECSSLEDDEQVATSAPGLPNLFDTYSSATSSNELLRARKYSGRRVVPGSRYWFVDVTFETPPVKQGTGGSGGSSGGGGSGGGTGEERPGQYENPILELAEVEMHGVEHEEITNYILDTDTGNIRPVTNSAGEVYDPPPKDTVTGSVLTIERNEPLSAPHPAMGNTYRNTVNADAFWGLPPGCWRCIDIVAKRAVRQLPNGQTGVYLRVKYTFESRATWDTIILDAGRYFILLPASAVNTPANVSVPIFAPGNPWVPVTVVSLPTGFTVSATRAQRREFTTREGHPVRGALNGQGGPLPDASTFTASSGTSLLTVPAPPATNPGNYVNGLAVQLWNTGGALPAPLKPNTTYYTASVAAGGLSFGLATSPFRQVIPYTGYFGNGSTALNVTTDGQFLDAGPPGLEVGMSVQGEGIAAGTTIASLGGGNSEVTLSIAATDAGNGGTVIFSTPLSPVTLTTNGSGVNTIKPLGVFGRIRKKRWLPFKALALPQSFRDVQ
jgi:hypothetical protein